MKKIKLFLALVLFTPSAFAATGYVFESLDARTILAGAGSEFCISKVYYGLRDYSAYSGNPAGYSCGIKFSLRTKDGAHQLADRIVTYKARPVAGSVFDHGQAMEKHFGYFGYFGNFMGDKGGVLDSMIFAPLNAISHGLYAGLSYAAEVESHENLKRAMAMMPAFSDIFSAMSAACQVTSLELMDLACDESVKQEAQTQLNAFQSREPLYRAMIPKHQ